MDALAAARQVIEECDREMAALFEKRMAAAKDIAFCKKERGLPVYVPEREAWLLEKNSALISDPAVRAYYGEFLRQIMDVSKRYQQELISGGQDTEDGPAECKRPGEKEVTQ